MAYASIHGVHLGSTRIYDTACGRSPLTMSAPQSSIRIAHTAILDYDFLGALPSLRAQRLHFLDNVVVSFEHLTEYDMFSVQVRCGLDGEEKLRTVGVSA